jgi:hypothetical protein
MIAGLSFQRRALDTKEEQLKIMYVLAQPGGDSPLDCVARPSDVNPHATNAIQKIPRKIPQTNPTQPDESDTTGQVFLQIRMNPTSPDHSDRLQPPHNPSVVSSILTGPTN